MADFQVSVFLIHCYSIKNVVPTDLKSIIDNSKIEKVICNGKTSGKYYDEVDGRITGTLDEHKKYFDYLKAGNGDKAYSILIDHLILSDTLVFEKCEGTGCQFGSPRLLICQ